MSPLDLLRAAGSVLGIVLAIPILVLVVRTSTFIGRALATLDRVDAAMSATTEKLAALDTRVAVAESRIEQLADQPPVAAPATPLPHGFPPFRSEAAR